MTCSDDSVFECEKLIIAIPPLVASNITFTPKLPDGKMKFLKGLTKGRVAKCWLFYDTPFWRHDS